MSDPRNDHPESATAEQPNDAKAAEQAGPSHDDLTRALRFAHLLETQTQARVAELSATVYGLLETLIADGNLSLQDYERRRQSAVVRENERGRRLASVQVADVADKYALLGLPEIDCASRLELCHARCCQLDHVLAVQDLEERAVRWDYGQPYVIARDVEGRCLHSREGRCEVYDCRPASCRLYDCRKDPRIWQDFDRRLPAPRGAAVRSR